MRILISGGSGLVGRALEAELSVAGHQCTVLSRNPEGLSGFSEGTELEAWDAVSSEPLEGHLSEADAVVHLLGENIAAGRWTDQRKRRIRDSRVLSTRAMATAVAATASPPSVFVQASAVGYYGPRQDELIHEDQPAGEDFLAQVCRDWEASSEGLESVGVRRILVRTGIVLSATGGALPRMALPFRLFGGGPVGNGRQWMPWIHIADEVGAIRFLIEHREAAGPFNLTAPHPATNRHFSRALGRVMRRPSLVPAPAFALRLMLGEMADLLLTGQRAVPQRLLDLGYRFRFPELEAALRDLLSKH